MATHERREGATPNGGVYSELWHLDKKGNVVDEKKAVRCVIRECDREGNTIAETWGIYTPKKKARHLTVRP